MLKLGVVSYLNSLPLWTPLQNRPNIEIIRTLPSKLQELLDAHEIDIALLPVADFLRYGGTMVSDACIGADGPVRSVLLFSRVPLPEIRSVAVDTSSHSSVALLGILLRDSLQVLAEFHPQAPDLSAMLHANDTALIIGDAALEAAQHCPDNVIIWDLAEAWRELTSLAFVFAAWIARADITKYEAESWSELLNRARNEGLQNLPQLAREFATPTLNPALIESYFRSSINYQITPRHRAGLDEFRRRLAV